MGAAGNAVARRAGWAANRRIVTELPAYGLCRLVRAHEAVVAIFGGIRGRTRVAFVSTAARREKYQDCESLHEPRSYAGATPLSTSGPSGSSQATKPTGGGARWGIAIIAVP